MISKKLREDSLSYLKESRKYVYGVALAFLLFIALGFTFSSHLSFIDEVLEKIVSEVGQLEGTDVALYIFANNVQAALIGMVFGAFLGIVPSLNILVNGIVIGYVLSMVTEAGGLIQAWKILPHGIFELPAVFIALGLGIKLGMSFFSAKPLRTLKERFYFSAAVFLTIILPLLAVAATIEGLLIAISD